jgi:hypothetical protein
MKKFLVVLLSLGLIVAFGATASAADVKFSGSYYVVGLYGDNPGLIDQVGGTSRASFWQRFRVMPVFQIAEGLSLTGRFDAMEKGWGNTNWKGGADDMNQSRKETQSFGNPNVQENFEWERGYMTFMTAIGQFDIGYQQSGKWGTDFLDDEKSRPRIKLTTKAGPVTMLFVYEKQFESVYSSQAGFATTVDTDNENYAVGAIYAFKGGNAGLLYKFTDNRYNRLNSGYASKLHYLAPYMKATFGPVYVEAELDYMFGKAARMDSGTGDVDADCYAGYVKVRADMGPAYFGGYVMYTPGKDIGDPTKKKDWTNASGNGSQDLDAGIMLGNDWLQTWAGQGGNGSAFKYDSAKYNSIIYGAFAGFKPTPKLTLEAMLLYAQRDKIEEAAQVRQNDSKKLGTEFDITASYKIYDNLTYMVGAAYLFTGDAFKGYGANSVDNKVSNDYLLLNKISVSF